MVNSTRHAARYAPNASDISVGVAMSSQFSCLWLPLPLAVAGESTSEIALRLSSYVTTWTAPSE